MFIYPHIVTVVLNSNSFLYILKTSYTDPHHILFRQESQNFRYFPRLLCDTSTRSLKLYANKSIVPNKHFHFMKFPLLLVFPRECYVQYPNNFANAKYSEYLMRFPILSKIIPIKTTPLMFKLFFSKLNFSPTLHIYCANNKFVGKYV